MKNIFFYHTEIGQIGIEDNGEAITNIYFGDQVNRNDVQVNETALIMAVIKQLQDYFAGNRKSFDFPYIPDGTPFQQRVWKALQEIPFGETRSYGEIAKSIGQPKASRAVGMANNKNPIPIIIPCHRVIGANGKLVGYAGELDVKEHLLSMEKKSAIGDA